MSDKEKLIELMKAEYFPVTSGFGTEEQARWLLTLETEVNWEDIADHLIANNVVIQKQAEWIEHPHFNFEGGYSGSDYECSECHYNDDIYEPLPFCPNCGAKMKEVK